MTFNWSEYLELARSLAGTFAHPHSDEAKYRAAISRAYYAAFCIARDYLLTDDPSLEMLLKPTRGFGPTGVHQEVRNQFESRDRRVVIKLRLLFERRLIADYENPPVSLPTSSPNFEDIALSSCNASWEIIDRISRL